MRLPLAFAFALLTACWGDEDPAHNFVGDDFAKTTDLDATVRRVTSANLQATAKRMFDPKHYVRAVLVPTSSPASAPPRSTASDRGSASPPP